MIKYSKFTDNTGSGNLTDTFSQITSKFKNSGGGGGGGGAGATTPTHTPARHALDNAHFILSAVKPRHEETTAIPSNLKRSTKRSLPILMYRLL